MLKNDLISKKNTNELTKKKISWKDFIPSMVYWPGIITQAVLVFFYYNFYQLDIFNWLGWAFMVFFLLLGGLPKSAFKKYGDNERKRFYLLY